MAVNVKLPRLLQGWRDQPKLLERYWDIAMSKIEDILNQLLAIPAIEDALADLDAAIADAQEAADNANAAAGSVTSETSLTSSYPSNFVSPLISSDNTGVVTIANHDRVYGDSTLNPTVAVVGGIVATGTSPGQTVRVYYNDPTRSGGSVTYLFTVDPAEPPVQTGDTHSVGAATVPAGAPEPGGPVRPPGWANPIP